MWESMRDNPWQEPLSHRKEVVIPTPQTRRNYINFATAASQFSKQQKPVRFHGEHWVM